MKSDFLLAVTQLATERRLPRDVVVDAIEAALVSAFKKEVVGSDNISVKILPTTGDIVLTIHKIIVDSVKKTDSSFYQGSPEEIIRATTDECYIGN